MTGTPANPMTAFYPEIRQRISRLAAECRWPAFEEQVERHLTRTRLPLPVLLPVSCAAATGGDPWRAMPVAAACALLTVSTRWFDDLQDRDRDESLWREVGPARATNYAATALTVAWRALAEAPELPRAALRAFGELTTELARGQDADLDPSAGLTLDEYWGLMARKTGAALALACRVGVLAVRPDDEGAADVCGRFGSHLGIALQILDDLDGTFHPDGRGDLAQGKLTLPALYALSIEHPGRDTVAAELAEGSAVDDPEPLLAILETTDAREFLIWSAFEERRRAMEALAELPPPSADTERDGRLALRAFGDAVMVGWERWLGSALDRDGVLREPGVPDAVAEPRGPERRRLHPAYFRPV